MRAVTNLVQGSLLGISLALASTVAAHASDPNTLGAVGDSSGAVHATHSTQPTHWPQPHSPGILPSDERAFLHLEPLTPYIVGFLGVGIIVLATTSLMRWNRQRRKP